jgi:protein phosphatase
MNSVRMAGLTDPGRVRQKNEDSIATWPEGGLAVLADGMGGHQAGEIASRIAIDVITRHFMDVFARAKRGSVSIGTDTITESIELANRAILDTARAQADYAGMGSTIVVAVFREGKVSIGHVGDSRLYRFRSGRLKQLTQDHSVVQELVSRGMYTPEEARQSVGKNLVTRALGVDPDVAVDVSEHEAQDADLYLLCSDGLNDVVSDTEIERILEQPQQTLDATVGILVSLANQRGGPDNISVILVDVRTPTPRNQKDEQSEADDADDDFRISRSDTFVVDDTK